MTISQTASDVLSRARQGLTGRRRYTSVLDLVRSAYNKDPQAAEVRTLTVGSATNDKTYTESINGVSFSFTASSSTSVTEVAAGLAAAINAEPLIRGQVSAESAVGVITLTATYPGQSFTVTDDDAQLTAALVTAAATASAVAFGRAVVADGTFTSESELCGKLAQESAFTAQTDAAEINFVSGGNYDVTIRSGAGEVLAAVTVPADTNDADTATAIAAALNGALAADTVAVTAPGSAGELTFTAEIAGLEYDVEIAAPIGGIVVAWASGASASTSLIRALLGVSEWSQADPAASIGGLTGQYAATRPMAIVAKGSVWVDSAESPAAGGAVWVDLTTGSDAGKFYAAAGTNRVKLPKSLASWESDGLTSSDGIAALRLAVA